MKRNLERELTSRLSLCDIIVLLALNELRAVKHHETFLGELETEVL